MNYYTYIYYDPSRNNEPIYVGKGKNDRAWTHLKSRKKHPFVHRLRFMRRNNIIPIIGIYAGLDEESALLLEETLITEFGRKDLGKGPLLNLTDGGGGIKNVSPETKKKMSESRKGHPGYMTGKKHTEEAKKRISDAGKGEKNPFFGKTHSEETKQKQSEVMKGRLVGELNPFFGKKHSKEVQDKISQQNIGRTHSDEAKRKIGEASRNRVRKPMSGETKQKILETKRLRKFDK